jgi:hypothetical protein
MIVFIDSRQPCVDIICYGNLVGLFLETNLSFGILTISVEITLFQGGGQVPRLAPPGDVHVRMAYNCETFHAEFGNLFTSAYPNSAVFVKNLLAMQTDSYIRINSANNNESRIVRIKQKTNMKFINKNIVI